LNHHLPRYLRRASRDEWSAAHLELEEQLRQKAVTRSQEAWLMTMLASDNNIELADAARRQMDCYASRSFSWTAYEQHTTEELP
jgi:hypothetical protein